MYSNLEGKICYLNTGGICRVLSDTTTKFVICARIRIPTGEIRIVDTHQLLSSTVLEALGIEIQGRKVVKAVKVARRGK